MRARKVKAPTAAERRAAGAGDEKDPQYQELRRQAAIHLRRERGVRARNVNTELAKWGPVDGQEDLFPDIPVQPTQ